MFPSLYCLISSSLSFTSDSHSPFLSPPLFFPPPSLFFFSLFYIFFFPIHSQVGGGCCWGGGCLFLLQGNKGTFRVRKPGCWALIAAWHLFTAWQKIHLMVHLCFFSIWRAEMINANCKEQLAVTVNVCATLHVSNHCIRSSPPETGGAAATATQTVSERDD